MSQTQPREASLSEHHEKNQQIIQSESDDDELLFDMLKDQFALFYALTVSAMHYYKKMRAERQNTDELYDGNEA